MNWKSMLLLNLCIFSFSHAGKHVEDSNSEVEEKHSIHYAAAHADSATFVQLLKEHIKNVAKQEYDGQENRTLFANKKQFPVDCFDNMDDRRTPLYYAAAARNWNNAKTLVELGAGLYNTTTGKKMPIEVLRGKDMTRDEVLEKLGINPRKRQKQQQQREDVFPSLTVDPTNGANGDGTATGTGNNAILSLTVEQPTAAAAAAQGLVSMLNRQK